MRAGTAKALALVALASGAFSPPSTTASGPVVEAQKAGDTRAGQPATPNRVAVSPQSIAELLGSFRLGPDRRPKYRRNTGWTNARYQRAARKRRNQQLNRRAHRG